MKYKVEKNDFEKALSLDSAQVKRLQGAIRKAYDQNWHEDGPNIDQINAFIAPYIKTQEEAFYAGQVILGDIVNAIEVSLKGSNNEQN